MDTLWQTKPFMDEMAYLLTMVILDFQLSLPEGISKNVGTPQPSQNQNFAHRHCTIECGCMPCMDTVHPFDCRSTTSRSLIVTVPIRS